jgi:rhodanese-related sulfurtransferase
MCGKSLGTEPFSTIGEQKKYNYAMQPMSKEAFMDLVKVDQPEAPDYFVHDAMLNRQERDSLDASMAEAKQPLSIETVLAMQADGAQVVDTRDPIDFAGAHLTGAINIGVNGKYATWAGTVLNREKPIVVIAEEDRVDESIMRLGRIGFDHVAGYLDGSMDALRDRSDLIATVDRISAPALAELDPEPVIIDVRSEKEWGNGHLRGSLNLPLNQLKNRLNEVPAGDPLIVHCQGGYRSSIAASLLQGNGRTGVVDLVGGFKAWQQSGLPVEQADSGTSCESGSGTCSV